MKDMRILFKFATRSRPQLFKRGLDSIINNCESENYIILVSVDSDDPTMSKEHCDNYKNTMIVCKTSESKVHAINRDFEFVSNWDILVNMSDDMVFTKKGFDNIIRGHFFDAGVRALNESLKFVHGPFFMMTDKCLHFPDGNRNDLITMAIMGREFYDRFGYIYHPDYKSLYCDDEMTAVAKQLGCYKYVDEQIVKHLHPAYGKAKYDKQYQHTESFDQADKQTFERRKANNFDL